MISELQIVVRDGIDVLQYRGPPAINPITGERQYREWQDVPRTLEPIKYTSIDTL